MSRNTEGAIYVHHIQCNVDETMLQDIKDALTYLGEKEFSEGLRTLLQIALSELEAQIDRAAAWHIEN